MKNNARPGDHITGVLHAGISVRDMDEALRWYEDVLGFRPVKDDGFVPPLQARICFVERDGFQLELFQYAEPKPAPEERLLPNTDLRTIGTKHIALRVDDMDAMRAALTAQNVVIAHEASMHGDRVLFIRDPSGVLIELIQPAEESKA